jgi:serine/threonine protein phosphatase 1
VPGLQKRTELTTILAKVIYCVVANFYIGDIHGQLSLLDKLLDNISPSSSDKLVFLGDYVDRGPQILELVDRLCELQDSNIGTEFLIGNHELLFFEYLGYQEPMKALGSRFVQARQKHSAVARFKPLYASQGVGGGDTLQQYFGTNPPDAALIPDRHRRFFESLQLWSRQGNDLLAVHAGVSTNPAYTTIDEVLAGSDLMSDILWSRECARGSWNGPSWNFTLVIGHTAQSDGLVKRKGNIILADANAATGMDLAAWSPEKGVTYALKSPHFI